MNIALIKNGKVANVIVADLAFANKLGFDQAVDTSGHVVSIGDNYNGQIFTKPEAAPEPVPPTPEPEKEYTFLEFLYGGRLTEPEVIALYAKEREESQYGLMVHISLDGLRQAKGILISHPNTKKAVDIWVAAGLITEERANEILQ
jgi:hypothetical protein